jgi:hypothetical protein
MPVAQAAKSVGFYVSLPEPPAWEATYEDQQACLIGIREELAIMLIGGRPQFINGEWITKPRRADREEQRETIGKLIAAIDKTHPPDNTALNPGLH